MVSATALPLTTKSSAERLFPRLTPAQIARVAAHGRPRSIREGEVLYNVGDPAVPFLLVIAGQVQALRFTADGEELVAVYDPGQFTGEVSMLSGRTESVAWLVSARRAVQNTSRRAEAFSELLREYPY